MKKVELHLHLDGSIDVNYARELVGRDVSNEMIGSGSKTLKEYLDKFQLPIKLLQDADNIENFAYLLGKELEKEEVIYAEIRFCPLFHVEKISVDRVVLAVINGLKKVSTVKVNLIFCMMRNFSFEDNLKIINLTKKYLGNGVCAIDLAGDEANYSTTNFEELFSIIREKEIPYTIHAGEADSYESVDSAVKFGTTRIGHGIRSIESNETINKLINNNITLEVCPTSNVDTNVVSNISLHPIKKLVDAGVRVCINTDNRTVSNTSLEKEYQLLRDNFGFTNEDFIKFNLNAIEAAFISDSEKDNLKKILLDKE